MRARLPVARSPRASVSGALLSATLLFTTFVGCGGEDEGDEGATESGGTAGSSGSGGSAASAGTNVTGGSAGRGGSSSSSGGTSGRGGTTGSGAVGGTVGKGGSGQGATGNAGSSSAGAGAMDGGAGEGASGGTTASGGSGGKGGAPPSGGGNGGSPYEIECHGDTLECGDPESLLCLGIRVGDEVFGYGCSNECETNADCSTEAASGEAAAECVDFVTTSYCLLVCQNGDTMKSCPGGMYCYAYPGSPIGYCLWE